jgi:SAM-dependent methyltransferase
VSDSDVRRNRSFWDADSDAYQDAHGDQLARAPLAWGAYRVPESELQILGAVSGRDVLELGCGAAQWSIALAARGARMVALDVSISQLGHARRAGPGLPLLQASAEQLPFADDAFDVVFCDHGALGFCDPAVSIPEVARVLRPGGLLAFCTTHPILYLTWDDEREAQTRKLQMDYGDLGRIALAEGTIDWVLPPGGWIRVLRDNGFDVEDLTELLARPDASTTYEDFAPPKWARRWPAEWIWSARRR